MATYTILPKVYDNVTTTSTLINTIKKGEAKEYAWDFEIGEFILKNGRPLIVTGTAAVKIWIYKALETARYKYRAYSRSFGQEYDTLIGRGYVNALIKVEAERLTREALFIHPDITAITNFTVELLNESTLKMDFEVSTTYGPLRINYN